ncbi:hypothetical protein QQG55_11875 [Brugia pahangi]
MLSDQIRLLCANNRSTHNERRWHDGVSLLSSLVIIINVITTVERNRQKHLLQREKKYIQATVVFMFEC